MALVSVIIPVYNTKPEYLRACLDSVIQQSHQELEIILVDDKSTNQETLATLCEYEAKDQRIKLIHNEKNVGLAFARNIGIDQALGKYITFLDSDDRFTPNCVETMEQTLEQNQTELALCDLQNFALDPSVDPCADELITDLPSLPYVDMKEFLQQKKFFILKMCAGGKMMRLDVYRERHMEFNSKLRIWEDFEWCCRNLPKFKSFSFIKFIGFMRLIHTSSLSQSQSMETKCLYTLLNVSKMVYLHFKQANLIELYSDHFLRYISTFALPRLSMPDAVDSTNLLLLVQSYKSLLESCGYTFNKNMSKLEVDSDSDKFKLVFQHVSNPNTPIVLQCNSSLALFVKVWAHICK